MVEKTTQIHCQQFWMLEFPNKMLVVFLPGEYHGQRSLAGYSPWGSKESDTAEQLHFHFHSASWASQGVNNTFAMQETWIWSLGWEDPLEKEMAIHSSTIAWEIPWTEDPGRLQSMGSQRVRHDWATSLYRMCMLFLLNIIISGFVSLIWVSCLDMLC